MNNKLSFSKVSCAPNPPHIWWCATGPLAFLPIHAAEIYGKNKPGFNISDYVVSYTPTLAAIIRACESHGAHDKYQGLLAISQPSTPGQSKLPNTEVELDIIKEQATKFGVRLLRGLEASMENVIEGMEAHSWVHFTCHGMQDTIKPLKSAFCLHDKHLELSTIIVKSFPHADLAFLSACQTATGDEKLPEEAVHLAAGLMLAGYGSIIATTWSIKDEDAPVIMGHMHVYTELFGGTEPDSSGSVVALHHAVKLLRQQVGDDKFLSWVPFIHVGV
jgi:CHAT domain-containing protein